jgi:hypothetical protein
MRGIGERGGYGRWKSEVGEGVGGVGDRKIRENGVGKEGSGRERKVNICMGNCMGEKWLAGRGRGEGKWTQGSTGMT